MVRAYVGPMGSFILHVGHFFETLNQDSVYPIPAPCVLELLCAAWQRRRPANAGSYADGSVGGCGCLFCKLD